MCSSLGVLSPQPRKVLIRLPVVVSAPRPLFLLRFESPVAELVHADAEFTRNLRLRPLTK
jgi:hypothetical protein